MEAGKVVGGHYHYTDITRLERCESRSGAREQASPQVHTVYALGHN